jgi:hypothetical protein
MSLTKLSTTTANDATVLTVKAVDQSKVNSTMIFYSSTLKDTELIINFICPTCKQLWDAKLDLTEMPKQTEYDFNKLVSFLVPEHQNGKTACSMQGKTVELFIAVHKDKNGLDNCVQKSNSEGANGLSNDWWVKP